VTIVSPDEIEVVGVAEMASLSCEIKSPGHCTSSSSSIGLILRYYVFVVLGSNYILGELRFQESIL